MALAETKKWERQLNGKNRLPLKRNICKKQDRTKNSAALSANIQNEHLECQRPQKVRTKLENKNMIKRCHDRKLRWASMLDESDLPLNTITIRELHRSPIFAMHLDNSPRASFQTLDHRHFIPHLVSKLLPFWSKLLAVAAPLRAKGCTSAPHY